MKENLSLQLLECPKPMSFKIQLASCSGRKLKAPAKKRKSSSELIKLDNQLISNMANSDSYPIRKEVPTMENISATLKAGIKIPGGKLFWEEC
jgi:hypothetical protein